MRNSLHAGRDSSRLVASIFETLLSAEFVQRAGESCEDSGKWLAIKRIVHLELIISARRLPLTADQKKTVAS